MPAPNPTLIRTDLDVPVFVFQTESDVAGGFAARQPDTNRFRQWEAAGTSHFDTYGLLIGPSDTGDGQGAVANLEAMQHPTNVPGPGGLCTLPINTGGAHWLLNSAIYWLNQWVTNGTPPPIGQPLQIASTSPFAYAKDANGNTIGGVRTPHVDAPIATLGGYRQHRRNTASPSRGSAGSSARRCRTRRQQLAALYKNHGQFVSAWSKDIQKLVKDGFLLKPDGVELQNSRRAIADRQVAPVTVVVVRGPGDLGRTEPWTHDQDCCRRRHRLRRDLGNAGRPTAAATASRRKTCHRPITVLTNAPAKVTPVEGGCIEIGCFAGVESR